MMLTPGIGDPSDASVTCPVIVVTFSVMVLTGTDEFTRPGQEMHKRTAVINRAEAINSLLMSRSLEI